ncbi:MAG: hypothetical protein JWO92_1051 [Chitinophagaceae bacterium]|nr:hypothetical protein [Chitinophagaceae bacterium]MDB5223756.1 hypothetical protein [Chitinophagaceae bacterium]
MQQTKKLLLIIAIILISAVSVSAQNVHFIGSPSISDNGTTLSFCAKLAGLGNNQLVTVVLNTTATITTECTNPGGNVAPGQTKTSTLTKSGDFMSDKNGTVTFCLTTEVPAPGKCPNGQWTGTVTEVSFANSSVSLNGKTVR